MTRLSRLMATLGLLFMFVPPSHSTQVVPATLEYMTDFSDTIVIGHVVDKESYWEDQKIFTSVIVEVSESVKNARDNAPSEIEIKIPGGKVGDMAFEVDQAPTFKIGEKVMLFLKKADDTYVPFGFNYGVYEIFWNDAEQKEFISGPLFSRPAHYNLRTMQSVENPEPSRSRELTVFLEEVQKLVK